MPPSNPTPSHAKPNKRSHQADDTWVDQVADEVTALLKEQGLDLELLVLYDPICETLHSVGYDGAPARYMSALGEAPARPRPCVPRDEMRANSIDQPTAQRPETNNPEGA